MKFTRIIQLVKKLLFTHVFLWMCYQVMKSPSVSWLSISELSLKKTTQATSPYTSPPYRTTRTSLRSHLPVCREDPHCFWSSLMISCVKTAVTDFFCSSASPEDAKHRKTRQGKTALFLAVEKGLLDNACFLLDHGSSPDALDKEEDSPLVVGQ